MSEIIPIILIGGSGSRLWPLSRASKPKQFLELFGGKSLFQQTLLRCCGHTFDDKPIIIGSRKHRFLIAEDLAGVDFAADILLEPVARNSCAAIAAACFHATERDQNATVLVLAADHHIPDTDAFAASISKALPSAQDGNFITFGIKPTHAATGYGYIRLGEEAKNASVSMVDEFKEKPSTDKATEFIENGYLWNSGNFLFKASEFLEELKLLAPEIFTAVEQAYLNAYADLDFLCLAEDEFS